MGLDGSPGAKCEHVYPPAPPGVAGEARSTRHACHSAATYGVNGWPRNSNHRSRISQALRCNRVPWRAAQSKNPMVEFEGAKQRQCAIRVLVLFVLSRGEKCFKCHNDCKEVH